MDQRAKVLMRREAKFMLECQLLFLGEKESRGTERSKKLKFTRILTITVLAFYFVFLVESWSINDAQRCWFLLCCIKPMNHYRVDTLSISFPICKSAQRNSPKKFSRTFSNYCRETWKESFHCFPLVFWWLFLNIKNYKSHVCWRSKSSTKFQNFRGKSLFPLWKTKATWTCTLRSQSLSVFVHPFLAHRQINKQIKAIFIFSTFCLKSFFSSNFNV